MRGARARSAPSSSCPSPASPTCFSRSSRESLRSGALARRDDAEDVRALIGESPALRRLRSQIDLYAASSFPALVEGESGSGKERVAYSLHHLSPRARAPYLALNCAAISPALVEPTLFGYAKGAFTGAQAAKSGYFEDAARRHALPRRDRRAAGRAAGEAAARARERRVPARGRDADARVARAHRRGHQPRPARGSAAAGRFRSDLYHRLSVFTLLVPALRELGDDRLRLLDYYRALFAAKSGAKPFELDPPARARWLAYDFPGNVRELRNIVIRLATKYAGYPVGVAELEAEFAPAGPDGRGDPVARARAELASGKPFSLDAAMKGAEQAYLDAALEIAQGNVSQAAKLLGVSRSTLYGRLEAAGRSGAKMPPSDSGDAQG